MREKFKNTFFLLSRHKNYSVKILILLKITILSLPILVYIIVSKSTLEVKIKFHKTTNVHNVK